VIFHDYYSDIPRGEVDRLVQSQELARLITVGDDSIPHVGLYPFVYDGKTLDLHLVRSDEQIKDLKAHPRCVLEVDDILAVIPSYWVSPEYAGAATAYHRTVIFECAARVQETRRPWRPSSSGSSRDINPREGSGPSTPTIRSIAGPWLSLPP
jgi:Putative FMN-binding domain